MMCWWIGESIVWIRGMGYGSWVRVVVRVGMGCEMRMGEDESGVMCVFGVYVVRWKEGGQEIRRGLVVNRHRSYAYA